jgi:hypothetical protein
MSVRTRMCKGQTEKGRAGGKYICTGDRVLAGLRTTRAPNSGINKATACATLSHENPEF